MQARPNTGVVVFLALIAGLIGGLGGAFVYGIYLAPPDDGGTQTPPPRTDTVQIKTETDAIVQAVAATQDAVLKIETLTGATPTNLWDYLYGPRVMPGVGSGFFFEYEDRLLVLTNAHVVADAQEIMLELADGRRVKGKLIGAEAGSDIAVVEPVDLQGEVKPLALGDSDAVKVGEWVIAMGNPFGHYTGTVTVGVVSATGFREVGPEQRRNVIQTDAAINRGNSGGPLLNLAGQVVGINYAIYSENREMTTVGIGFAIPINEAELMLHFLIHGGPWLGIGDIVPNSAGFARYAGLATDQGVVVMEVFAGGPAAQAGLREGDVIMSVGGKTVINGEDLREAILAQEIGQQVPVVINRGGQQTTLNITAGRIPGR
ncbi:MAG TPA: protease DO family protein [Armatimonadetes bacterium]|nr:protease DO family protein [Armatimonadota bacterium]